MSSQIRTTRECSFSQIDPVLIQAIREYFDKHHLGDPQVDTVMCCETISETTNPGSLAAILNGNPDRITHLAILLLANWLIWARNGDRTGVTVSGAKLSLLKVKAFVTRRSKEMELEVSGFVNETKDFVRGNLELGPELAAQKLCNEVGQAVDKAKPASKRTRKWFGS
jgi:hypothetical protein